jgi:hypothetical protein
MAERLCHARKQRVVWLLSRRNRALPAGAAGKKCPRVHHGRIAIGRKKD